MPGRALLRCGDGRVDQLRELMDFARERRVHLERPGELELDVSDLLLLRTEAGKRGLEVPQLVQTSSMRRDCRLLRKFARFARRSQNP